ncbi:hypothetical protein [Pseudonocardia sp. N23]|uniref:hypothetical protein n=1 Tax=Pseudonocardia sp. N23 TaxID=1987376 RepID=UPI000BFD7CB5|nr:hypothetical protein [Pseudonocardia sp. N23]GAY07887.1 hypothetical protein TOK_5305 [Pseudonocardia sp. N23]
MTRPIRLPDGVAAPQIETVLGALWWIAGALALSSGVGTALMAAGLGATGVLWTLVRGRQGDGRPLGPARRARLIRQGAVGGVLAAAALVGLPMLSWGEVAVPVAAALVAVVLFSVAPIVGSRSFVAVGSGLLVLSAVGALVALGTVGVTAPQGIVGFGGAALLWPAGALRTGVLGGPTVRAVGRWLRVRLTSVRTLRERREERRSDQPTMFAPAGPRPPAPRAPADHGARPAAPPPAGHGVPQPAGHAVPPPAGHAAPPRAGHAGPPSPVAGHGGPGTVAGNAAPPRTENRAGGVVPQRPRGPAARPVPSARPPAGAGRGRTADPFAPTVRTRTDTPSVDRDAGDRPTAPVRTPGPPPG